MVLESPGGKEKTRADIIAELGRAQAAFNAAPDNAEARYLYANLLHISGEFWKAWEVAKVFSQETNPSLKAQALVARLAFLLGDYVMAERLYGALITATKNDTAAYVSALVGLMFTYYEQNKFDAIKALQFPAGVELPQRKAITAFEGQPYSLEWSTNDKVALVPFVMTDPVPLLMVEVNRVPIAVFFDTGADTLIIDPDIAQALDIESTVSAKTPFGGGLEAEFGIGQVASLKLGDVTMRNVPAWILPSKRFSDIYKNKGIILGGIVGTAMLRQFLATVDYEHGRFVLRERTISSLESLRESQREKDTVAIPFVLDYPHFMLTRGGLNDQASLTLFVDSGLASDSKFAAPLQTLTYLGIPVPAVQETDSVGGGGGVWKRGFFSVDSIRMGPLVQKPAKGEFGALAPEFYWSREYIQDALISHRFLREYATWTLDFDGMTYIFAR
jgi:hypothetical protein